MTPSKYIKSQGLPSLAYVAREAGVNARTLHNWYHDKNKLFEVVVAGVWLKWADENKEPNPTITEQDKEEMRALGVRLGLFKEKAE